MEKKSILLILIYASVLVFSSGCIDTNPKNQTWGEKTISKDLIKIEKSSGNHQTFNNKNFYYVSVTLKNENSNDVLKIQLLVQGFDEKGQLVAENSTPYINNAEDTEFSEYAGSNNSEQNSGSMIPAYSKSTFYYLIYDPDNRIVNYTVKLVNAQANL